MALSDGSEALGYAGGLLERAKGGEKESGRAGEGSRRKGVKSREGERVLARPGGGNEEEAAALLVPGVGS